MIDFKAFDKDQNEFTVFETGYIQKGDKDYPAVFFKGEAPDTDEQTVYAMIDDEFRQKFTIASAFIGIQQYRKFDGVLKEMFKNPENKSVFSVEIIAEIEDFDKRVADEEERLIQQSEDFKKDEEPAKVGDLVDMLVKHKTND